MRWMVVVASKIVHHYFGSLFSSSPSAFCASMPSCCICFLFPESWSCFGDVVGEENAHQPTGLVEKPDRFERERTLFQASVCACRYIFAPCDKKTKKHNSFFLRKGTKWNIHIPATSLNCNVGCDAFLPHASTYTTAIEARISSVGRQKTGWGNRKDPDRGRGAVTWNSIGLPTRTFTTKLQR